MLETILSYSIFVVPAIIAVIVIIYFLSLRRIVPTNVVHIVQRGKNTESYGVGKESGNVYYEFPKWLPKIGVEVRELPVSNFDIGLQGYPAYDKDRVPFVVDVKAFFRIIDTNKAAERVESFQELLNQAESIVQGAIRSILAKSKLEDIMEERSVFGIQFTELVHPDLASWGVEPIKNIELMDVRDAEGSNAIKQIMAKRMSAIETESRVEVADNNKRAIQAELDATNAVNVRTAETKRMSGEAQALSTQAINIANAEAAKVSGIAEQQAKEEIAVAEQKTTGQIMEVQRIKELRQAEIDRDKAIIDANQDKERMQITAAAEKFKVETDAAADLEAKKLEAQGIKSVGEAQAEVVKAKGIAEAESKKAMELAGVTAQTTLAKEIGENKPYQEYLLRVKEIEVSQVVGVAQYQSIGEALAKSDLKMMVNSGDINSGVNKLTDIFSSKGGSQINGLLEVLKQTEEGKSILKLVTDTLGVTDTMSKS